jgi:sugar phosphate isomerase/epimerase
MLNRRQFLAAAPLAAALPRLAWAAATAAPQVACQGNAWQIKTDDFADLLKRLADMKRLGYAAFECNVRFVEGQFATAAEARRQIAATGMTFYGSHTGVGQKADYLDKAVDGVASLGAKHFAVSGSGGVVKDGKLNQEALTKKIEAIARVAKRCQQAGLRLVYHNHQAEFLAGGVEIQEILRRTDPQQVFLLFDIGHAHRAQADVVAFFTANQQRIDAMHLRDIRGDKQVPLGQGELNLAALAAAAKKADWHGWLTVEEENLGKSVDVPTVESVLTTDRRAINKFFGV